MRARLVIAVLGSLALLAAACDDGEGNGNDLAEDAETPEELGEPEGLEQPEMPDPVDLEEGVAAHVEDTDIREDTVEARYTAILEIPEIAEQLEGEEGEAITEQVQAEILTQLVLEQVIADGARDLDVEPSDEEVAEIEDEAAEQAGGEEALDEQLAGQGLTGAEDRQEAFRLQARLEAITEEVAGDIDEDEALEGEEAEELGMDPEQIALQEWLLARIGETDIQVDEQYGVWNPEAGQVMPTGTAG